MRSAQRLRIRRVLRRIIVGRSGETTVLQNASSARLSRSTRDPASWHTEGFVEREAHVANSKDGRTNNMGGSLDGAAAGAGGAGSSVGGNDGGRDAGADAKARTSRMNAALQSSYSR